jgi:hypothetical protein
MHRLKRIKSGPHALVLVHFFPVAFRDDDETVAVVHCAGPFIQLSNPVLSASDCQNATCHLKIRVSYQSTMSLTVISPSGTDGGTGSGIETRKHAGGVGRITSVRVTTCFPHPLINKLTRNRQRQKSVNRFILPPQSGYLTFMIGRYAARLFVDIAQF